MRTIDADELLKLIEKHSYLLCDYHNSKDKGMFLCGIQQAVAEMPTVEQNHGHWIGKASLTGLCYECSICGKPMYGYLKGELKFCPHCGAKMNETTEKGGE